MQTPPFMSAGLSARKHTQALHIIDLPREGQWSDYKQSGHIGTSVSYFKAALTHWLPLFTLYKTLSTLSVRLAPSTAWTGDTITGQRHSLLREHSVIRPLTRPPLSSFRECCRCTLHSTLTSILLTKCMLYWCCCLLHLVPLDLLETTTAKI